MTASTGQIAISIAMRTASGTPASLSALGTTAINAMVTRRKRMAPSVSPSARARTLTNPRPSSSS
jgi:hypothetical protein